MVEQLKLDLSEIQEKETYVNLDDKSCDDSSIIVNNKDDIIYKSRLKNLIKNIADNENFEGIQISKRSIDRFETTSKLLISILIFDIIYDLDKNERKKITEENIDVALDRILGKASAMDITLKMLNEDINKLRELNKTIAISKATDFINK